MMILFITVPLVLVTGIAALICRRCSLHRIRPSIWVAIISTFIGSAICGLAGALMEPCSPWQQDVKTGLYWFPTWMGLTALVTFLPAVMVVFIYQRKMKRLVRSPIIK